MGLMTISHREKNVLVFSREIDFFSKNIVKKKNKFSFFEYDSTHLLSMIFDLFFEKKKCQILRKIESHVRPSYSIF